MSKNDKVYECYNMKELETDRLVLRKVAADDLDDLFNNWGVMLILLNF